MSKTIDYLKQCFNDGKELGKQKKREHKQKLREIMIGGEEEECENK